MTLLKLIKRLSYLYGKRYDILSPGRLAAIDDLLDAIADLQRQVRKHAHHESHHGLIAIALVVVIEKLSGVIHNLEPLELLASMARKFPSYGCCYCHKLPCACQQHSRPDPQISCDVDRAQLTWTLHRWMRHSKNVYGPYNRQHKIEYMLGRLFQEAIELRRAQRDHEARTLDEAKQVLMFEVCDTFSWIFMIANFFKINLARVFAEQYGKHCPRCKQPHCGCPLNRRDRKLP